MKELLSEKMWRRLMAMCSIPMLPVCGHMIEEEERKIYDSSSCYNAMCLMQEREGAARVEGYIFS